MECEMKCSSSGVHTHTEPSSRAISLRSIYIVLFRGTHESSAPRCQRSVLGPPKLELQVNMNHLV